MTLNTRAWAWHRLGEASSSGTGFDQFAPLNECLDVRRNAFG